MLATVCNTFAELRGRNTAAAAGLLLAAAAACCIGCGGKVASQLDDAAVQQLRNRLLLAEEPTADGTPLTTPEELREQLAAAAESAADVELAGGRVLVIGQVGGVPNPWKEAEPNFPWKRGEATFFLVDPAAADAYADHSGDDPDHAETCPFCSKNSGDYAKSIAVVTFAAPAATPTAGRGVSQAGFGPASGAAAGGSVAGNAAAAIDANKLLPIKKGSLVVVRGRATLAGDLLVIQADGLHVRQ
ncbi:MAG: hypothetical protein AAF790_06250 [Planctomycetota bacterium]